MSGGAGGTAARAIGRVVILAGAGALAALVFVSAERARPASTQIGTALGLEPLEPRLAAISDGMALAHRQPSAADFALAQHAAVAAPLDALPYYIATAAPQRSAAEKRARIALALQRDPRLRPALTWRLNDLAKAGDAGGVARALIQLALLTPENTQLWPAVAQISADPVARAAIKTQLVAGAGWRDVYLDALSHSSVDRAVVFEMLQSVGRRRSATVVVAPGQYDDRRSFLAALIARKQYEQAYLAWVQWLPAKSQGAVGYVFDGQFTGAAALPPFAWQLSDGVGGATAIDPAGGLSLDYTGTDGAVVATQMLLLAPGRYRLVTAANFASASNENGGSPLGWTVQCAADSKPLGGLGVPLQGALKTAAGAPFDVPAGCDAQTLLLKVNSAEFAKRLSGKIRSISVEAVK